MHDSYQQLIVQYKFKFYPLSSGVPRNFVGGGGQQIQLRTGDRENGDLGGGSPLVRGSGGSCNLVQEISFHMVKFS